MAELTRLDWIEINSLQDAIQEIMKESRRIRIDGMDVPECCFPGKPDYDTIIAMKARIRRIRKGTDVKEQDT